ncbi:hypothetical protein chiPu_0014538 [Chiloscyllium punctatum]|uniref:Uncharacterized protein n=1 Tax=Chiloscyllium punctatum TaxID=137246 RepID=A0A401T097_CHIPU|nr:hypothetical protein [Chiloscyllium punctatum]
MITHAWEGRRRRNTERRKGVRLRWMEHVPFGGNMDICCVCKARCHTLFLSDKMDPDLKALFTQPEKICERYLKEFVQIMDFQEKHRRHLCANEIEEVTVKFY